MCHSIKSTQPSCKRTPAVSPWAWLLAVLLLAPIAANATVVFMEDFESGTMANWTVSTLIGTSTALTSDNTQARRGTWSALEDNSSDYMFHDLGVEQSGALKATFWIYDGTQARSYGELRAYSTGGYGSGSLQQIFAVGKYNTVTLTGEVFDGTKYQARFYVASGGWFNLNDPGAPSRSTGWHKFEIVRRSDGTTVEFYVDGILSRTVTATAADMDSVLIGGTATVQAGDAWFDDVIFEDSTGGYLGNINTQPLSQTKLLGEGVTFSVSVSDSGTPAYLSYQWKKDGNVISGATDSALAFTVGVNSNGTYTVDVMGAFGTNSASAVLTIGAVRTWAGLGGDNNWSTTANWAEGALGLSGYPVHFDGSTRLTPNMENDYSVAALEFNPGASPFVIGATAGKTLTLGGDVLQNSPNLQTLNLPIALNGTRAVNALAGDVAVNGVISGSSAGLTKAGANTLTLGAVNTYDGTTTISAGTLKLGVAGAIPSGTGKGSVSVAGTLDMGGFDQILNGLNGAGIVTNSGLGSVTNVLTIGNNNTASSFSGAIKDDAASDKVGWTKIGTGTFTFTGSTHTYKGDTTINAGTVAVNASTFFGDETGWLRLAGGALQISASHGSTTGFWNPVELSANTTLKASSSLASGTRFMRFGNPDGNNNAETLLTFTGGTLTLLNGGSGGTFEVQFKKMGGVVFSRPIVLNTGTRLQLCNDDRSKDALVCGLVTGAGQINYTCWGDGTGGKTLATNANNTYSGGSLLNGGYLGFGADSTGAPGALTAGPIGTGSLTINNDGWLGMFAWGAARTIGNNIIFGTLNDANALHLDGTNDLTFTGTVSLGVSNRTFAVDAGTMYFDSIGGKTYTFSGVISGGAAGKALTKTGPGKLVFNGNNTYSSSTIVSEGTLGGSGTIASLVTVQNATIAAGQSAGRLTLGGGLDLSSSGTDQWELAANNILNPGTDFDQIALTGGNLTLGGSSVLNVKFIGTATTPDLGNPFWQYVRRWKVIALSGAAANPGNSNFSAITGTESITAGTFTTTADATGVTLVYTPSVTPPAPTAVTTMNLTAGPGSDRTLNYSGGTGGQFVLMKTNLLAGPIMSHDGWQRVATNITFSGSFTIPIGPDSKAFYCIKSE